MSVNATTTVSTSPVATDALSSSKLSIRATSRFRPTPGGHSTSRRSPDRLRHALTSSSPVRVNTHRLDRSEGDGRPGHLGGRRHERDTRTAVPAMAHTSEDEQTLHKLGYAQELFRAMGGFSELRASPSRSSRSWPAASRRTTSPSTTAVRSPSPGAGCSSALSARSSHCRWPRSPRRMPTAGGALLLGLKARQAGLGLVHRLVQPRRPDRGDRGHRLRARDLRHGAAQPVVRYRRTRSNAIFVIYPR